MDKIFRKRLNFQNSFLENETRMKKKSPIKNIEKKEDKVINLNLFKIKKTLKEEGFEIEEKENGELKLIIRIP